MNQLRWFRQLALIATVAAITACNLAVSVGVSNTPESPERKHRESFVREPAEDKAGESGSEYSR